MKARFFGTLIFASWILSVFSSCQIGLGESVDIIGPSVTITSPDARQNVRQSFDISGTVEDDFGISTLTVTCGGNTWTNSNGSWQKQIAGQGVSADNDSEWTIANNGTSVNWTVKNVDIGSLPSGDYEIVVTAVDSSGNTSGNSRKTRIVVIDKNPPFVSVSSAFVKPDTTFFDSVGDYKDITKINTFIIKDFDLLGQTVDEVAIKYIDVIIKDSATEVYRKRLVQDEKYIGDAANYLVVDSLRSWDLPIGLAELGVPNDRKNVYYIYTESCDVAENETQDPVTSLKVISQGCFCVWKEADKPWIANMNLGATSSGATAVYSGSSVMGNAFDDSAISKVSVTLKDSSGNVVSGFNEKEVYSGTTENNVFFSFTAPSDCGKYNVTVKAKDDSGKDADPVTGYIQVVDNTFPSVEIGHKVGGISRSNGETLFGDESGDFKLEVVAKDDTDIKSLKIAYIVDPEDFVEYSNKDYSGWSQVSANWSDLKSKKVIEFTNLASSGNAAPDENGLIKKKFPKTLDLNVFSHLGINGITRKLTNQTFVVRVEDGTGNAITKDYTVLGDIEVPEVTFEKIEYKKDADSAAKTIRNETELLDAFTSTSCIKVFGTIKDNSLKAWRNNGKIDFKLKCNTPEITPVLSGPNANGESTFEAEIKNSGSSQILAGSSLIFEGKVTDYAGNVVTKNFSFLVNTQKASVDYISSDDEARCYNVDETIKIYIRFNKEMTFTKGTDLPVMTLNNGKTVSMTSPGTSGTRQFVFEYKVADGDDIDRLSVKGIDLKGGKIYEADNQTIEFSDVATQLSTIISAKDSSGNDYMGEKNLGGIKDITVITKRPEIDKTRADGGISFNEITGVLTLTFTKPVQKGSGVVTIKQDEATLRVPPVFTESEYRNLKGSFDSYYDHTTNGATGSAGAYVADTSAKYVLKYGYEVNDSAIRGEYVSGKNHILERDIRSSKAVIGGANKNVVTLNMGKLPCKGAEYTITVPAGIVADYKGKDGYESQNVGTKTFTATGVEIPVIRIKKTNATITNYVSSQPLTTEFKVDCSTPGATVTYSVQRFTRESYEVTGENTPSSAPSVSKSSQGISPVTNSLSLGDGNITGMEYEITATAIKNGYSKEGKEVAFRTIVRINGIKAKLGENKMEQTYGTRWGPSDCPGGIGLFIRGGNNISGPNSIEGYPTSWDSTDCTEATGAKTILMTNISGTNDYYMATWAITGDYYFRFLAGLMDSDTNTNSDGVGKGPKYGIYSQNAWVPGTNNHPVHAGGMVTIRNDSSGCDFDITATNGIKAQKYR